MSDTPTVYIPPPQTGASPSNSTVATLIGGSAASLLFYILATRGITLPAGAEAQTAILFATLAGYLPRSGRQ